MKKGKHLGIRIDEELHYKMQYIAAYEDRSLNGEVLYALRCCLWVPRDSF